MRIRRAVKNRIFVSIAAYRDEELARTLRDLLTKADRPEALTIAVLDQSEIPIPRPRTTRGAKVVIEHCPPAESQGACWARAQLQQRFDGEDYFLQLDAHHLFKKGWDSLLLKQYAACRSPRAVLTAYLPPYEPGAKPHIHAPASTPMHVSHFDQDGIVIYRSHTYSKETPGPPLPARFFSGHFAFARREFVERVPYDPELYFYGEESTMAARAFTSGFDLFHPGRTIAWHYYVRNGKPHHWDGSPKKKGKAEAPPWQQLQRRGVEKYRRIFCLLPHIWPTDGLGSVRSLADYEAWAGVDHYWQLTHPASAAMHPPPTSASPLWTVEEGLLGQTDLHVSLPPLASIDARPCSQVHLAILDATTRDAAAGRVTPADYATVQQNGWKVRVRFRSAPLRLIVWPLIDGVGWGNRHEVHLSVPELATIRPSRQVPPKTSTPPESARHSRRPRTKAV